MERVPLTFDDRVTDPRTPQTRGDFGTVVLRGLAAGVGKWADQGDGSVLYFTCPCGCGTLAALPVGKRYKSHNYTWDGEKVQPTVQEPVTMRGRCRWTGHLTKGVWTRS